MNLFEQYGIKEVADVTLYSIHKKKDNSGELYYVPALYLDTLKISTVEKDAENVWAEGGLGNARLVCWDYNKTINVTLEDALCTPASLGLCWGGILSADWVNEQVKIKSGINVNCEPEKMSRMEKVVFPINTHRKSTISKFLPHRFCEYREEDMVLTKSSVVDGVDIRGMGNCKGHIYNWRAAIESTVKSFAIIPDRFFDYGQRHFPINYKKPISVTTPTYENPYFSVVYHIGRPDPNDLRPPAVIVIDETQENTNRKFKITFTGKYGDGAQDQEEHKFVAYLEEVSGAAEGFDHQYKGEVIRPCGKRFKINEKKENGGILVSKNVQTGDFPEKLYLLNSINGKDGKENEIPLQEGSKLTITSDLKFYYFENPAKADYLKITVDNNNDYHAFLGIEIKSSEELKKGTAVASGSNKTVAQHPIYWESAPYIDVSQFKGLEMWRRFDSINALIYFIITKYENNILSIKPVTNIADEPYNFFKDYEQVEADHLEDKNLMNKLHAYVNPDTMTPYDDDYWFHQGETYYIKSLTLSTPEKRLKTKRIQVHAGVFPGMYMLVGETQIRNRDTGIDERLQLKFPLCKVKSTQSITLEADGEPTTFNLELEVARPNNGILMELTSYETAPKMIQDGKGHFVMVDGSTEILCE